MWHALELALRLILLLARLALWTLGTLWRGAHATYRLVRIAMAWRDITAEVRQCPRGHDVPQLGLFECACGARVEGHVFDPCSVCGQSAAYVPCGTCGLPVRNLVAP